MEAGKREIELLPLPQMCRVVGEPFESDQATSIIWVGEADARVAQRVHELLADSHCGQLNIEVQQCAGSIPALDDDESYQLRVNAAGITLTAPTTWGALHGVTTLWQLHACGQLHGASLLVEDRPRFSWRGVLIDVARHFMSLGMLLRVVDGMARLKMNVLHLHITDDQGFRFTSAAFPNLASDEAYTQAELKALVTYAAARGVRVVPELDVPGHVSSWLQGYPAWGVKPADDTIKFGVHRACLNPTDESVYAALDTLFLEVGEVFPDRYVHIGGDEVHPAWWTEDPGVQEFIATHKLEDTRGLQAYFNRRLCASLTAQGKCVIAWDEVLHESVPDMVVQNWRGATTRDIALAQSLDCVVSAGYYLDLFYPAEMHYRYDPEASQAQLIALEEEMKQDLRLAHVAQGMDWTVQWRNDAIDIDALPVTAKRGRVLGGEACLWAELVDEATLETRLWSRLPAVAERLWSAATVTDLTDFYRRLQHVLTLPGIDVVEKQAGQLQSAGLSVDQAELAKLFEPVKWYARLLGEQALQARLDGVEMPQARPYDATTSLDRVVDFIAPESLVAKALEAESAAQLRGRCEAWSTLQPQSWPQDMQAAISSLSEVGIAVLDLLDQTQTPQQTAAVCKERLRSHYVPRGEYMLAVVPPLLNWIDRWLADGG